MSVENENTASQPYGTAILKAAKILEYLSTEPNGQGTSEIARQTQMNKSTVFKLLETLQLIGFIEKSPDNSHNKIGLGLAKFAHAYLQQTDIVRIAKPILEVLNTETGETVHLGVLDNLSIVYVLKLESKQPVRLYSKVGIAAPLYCTGIGKAALSTFNNKELDSYIEKTELQKHTGHTIVDSEKLREEMEKIRCLGYAVDNSEHEEDVRCVAIPLFTRSKLLGAISISSPRYRMDDEKLEKYVQFLRDAAHTIIGQLQVLLS